MLRFCLDIPEIFDNATRLIPRDAMSKSILRLLMFKPSPSLFIFFLIINQSKSIVKHFLDKSLLFHKLWYTDIG